jgi:hypothetical protein
MSETKHRRTQDGAPPAAARRNGATSPAAVIDGAPASLATEDELGAWLARNWGILADAPADLLEQIDL